MPGADANPYLAMAGSLLAGYLGVEEKLARSAEASGNAYPGKSTLPKTMEEALDRFAACEPVRALLGEDFFQSYLRVKSVELDLFQSVVTELGTRPSAAQGVTMSFNSGGFNSGLDIGKSYYVATANPAPDHPALQGDVDADLVVVGGGCTGLSAALHAAERGLKVVLLEGGKIGWGASGRNGGQMIPGLRKGAKGLVKIYGPERARALFDLAFEARGLVLGLIERHAIDCDLRLTGHLVGAVNGSDLQGSGRRGRMPRHRDELSATSRSCRRRRRAAKVDTPYHGAIVRAARRPHASTQLHAWPCPRRGRGRRRPSMRTRLRVRLEREPSIRVVDGQGLGAGKACRAGGRCAASAGLSRASTAASCRSATTSSPPSRWTSKRNVIPANVAVSDTRFVVNYYRMSADGRLLFGGGERYTPSPPADIAGFVRPHMEKTFPQLQAAAASIMPGAGWSR